MATQVASLPPQPLWYGASSPTYSPRRTSMMPRASTMQHKQQRTSTLSQAQAGRMSVAPDDGTWGGDYVGFRFPQPDATAQRPQEGGSTEESSGASTPESRGSSSGWNSNSSADANANGMAGIPAHKTNRKALRKLTRLVKKRGKNIAIITVFNSEGEILCSLAGAQAGQENTYEPSAADGKYLILALERGFKREGCAFDFGGTVWLSGQQEEVDDKQTMLGNESTEDFRHHRFYSVLSPTGRYLIAAVLKEDNGGQLDAKLLRKIRNMADNFEVYEAWAGSGKLMAKLACAA